ncbi:hypothetical protein [Streptomyces meridianus]|uniref:Lipoprotein n=1 Tax=Streptomyces meridianus TaxID=2938945 RepID=A0ABT0X193_9ACTN|nr:hypothetical protein [Streptomyces meridianus]MCM2576322.1 hypothetical protein [Streptomyces meridianus]
MMNAAMRRTALAAAITALAGTLLAGCADPGSGQGGAGGDGWGTLTTDRLTVSYPKGWQKLSGKALGRHNDAAAVLTEDGAEVGRIGVQLDFMTASDAQMAAVGAAGTYVTGGRTRSREAVEVNGTDDARRIEYHDRKSAGGDGAPPKGSVVRATDVVGMDGRDEAFLVRINVVEGTLSERDIDRIVQSIEVR